MLVRVNLLLRCGNLRLAGKRNMLFLPNMQRTKVIEWFSAKAAHTSTFMIGVLAKKSEKFFKLTQTYPVPY